MDYAQFIDHKAQLGSMSGFDPLFVPDFLFDFQKYLVEWTVQKGRAAIFADCGLGKTPMFLVWAQNVVQHTNRPVLVLTPLAVSFQTIIEADKFGIEARRSIDGTDLYSGIVVTNYERLHYFDPADFGGVVCDEASILKSFDGARRREITEFMRKVPYRLLDTATAAPNDYIELGTASEALGELGYTDMLGRFFKNDQNTIKPMRYTGHGNPRGKPTPLDDTAKWRFKGHAEQQFWRWVCSWARAVRRPSDLGFEDGRFILPPLSERVHVVEGPVPDGSLFTVPAFGLKEQREERRRTVRQRCEMVAELTGSTGKPFLTWCHLNDEGNLLAELMPDAVQVSGSDSDEAKEEKFIAFAKGQVRGMITKPKIGAWGLNWQHCAHVTTFPSHSFEQYYQGVRRCWRFGQESEVVVDIVGTDGDGNIRENQQRKADAADRMFTELVAHMNNSMAVDRTMVFTGKQEVPSWL